MHRLAPAVILLLLSLACSGERARAPGTASGGGDVGTSTTTADAGVQDVGPSLDAGEADAGEPDAGPEVMLPDPASGPPEGAILFGGGGWDGLPFDNETPQTALPLGTVNDPPMALYIQDDTSAFFVFVAGPDLTGLPVTLFVQDDVVDVMHLHDATGRRLGPQITPDRYEVTPGAIEGVWPTTPGEMYLFEIKLIADQFF